MNHKKLFFIGLSLFTYEVFSQEILEEKAAFDYFLKVTSLDRKDFVPEYMYETNEDLYDQYWDDEFEFNKKIDAQYEQIKNRIADIEGSYYMISKAEFGDYAPEIKAFRFEDLTETTYFNIKNEPTSYACKKCETFTDIDLFFLNSGNIKSFAVDPDKANILVKERKSSSGKVDREIVIKVYFQLADYYEIESHDEDHKIRLFGTISKIEILDYYGYNNRSGSGKIISTINLESADIEDEEQSLEMEDPEVSKLKAYITNSFVSEELKAKLLNTIQIHNN